MTIHKSKNTDNYSLSEGYLMIYAKQENISTLNHYKVLKILKELPVKSYFELSAQYQIGT